MLIKIECPNCRTEGQLSVVESEYEGPYRCWKCCALFTIALKNIELLHCAPLSEEELQRQQEIKAIKDNFKRYFP